MEKRFCVKYPDGGGDCFGFETREERIMAADIAAQQASEKPGSKIYECEDSKCRWKATSRRDIHPAVLLALPLVAFGAALLVKEGWERFRR